MLNIHFANRFETLSDLLVRQIGESTGSVFSQDQVIVPSAAVRRRLTLELARQHGICANVGFGYLARWLWQQIGQLVPGVQAESPFDPAVLAWRVYSAFEDAAWLAPHRRLALYLERADPVMRFELATRTAGLFDQYITYRPDWLEAWLRGESVVTGTSQGSVASASADQSWQAALWRRLCAELGVTEGQHPAQAFQCALDASVHAVSGAGAGAASGAVSGTASGGPALTTSAHVFCLPTLPPLHLSLLQSLGRRIELHVYLLNPCREYWFEVIDRRRLAYLAARGKDQDLYHEQGHPLLASWGQQTQSQLALIVDASDETLIDDAHFSRNPDNSLLARLQNSILDMTPLAPGSVPVADHDRSIEIHVCHSLTREIEVLHDRLLALFAGPDAPALGDILVVTPDLDAAAPLIDAVFGTAPKQRHIPFAITGRARSHVNSAARALLDLLALASSRFTVSSVFGLLQQPAVARRFGLAADDLEQVRAWLQAAGVHWALDAEHRGSLGVPALPRHSLADGMDRLFLGYALPSRTDAPFDGRLPAGDAEGSDTLALGALWQFVDALADLRRKVATPQPATAWAGLLADALADFVAPADHELEDLREVHDVLEGFGAQLGRSGLTERQPLQGLPFEVVRAALAEALDDPARGGVPTGMVTFASMSSLRNIPFKVVCAIGLNDGAFPTHARPLEFDLMSMQPRRGDRQRRIDERNVFLDLLLAARERVHLSYVGRSVRDNSFLPPSVLVSELMEYLIPAIANVPASAPADAAAFERARARLRIEHPLQPFSELAFRPGSDIRVRSFQREYAEALTSRLTRPNRLAPAASPGQADDDEVGADEFDDEALADPATRFFAAPLPEPGDEWRDVPLERLIEFFKNPCRYLLVRRLAVELRRDEDELQDDEPFLPDVPGRTALANRLLPLLLDGCDIATARSLALAGTEVPTGAFGRQFLERELAGLHDFAARVIELTREPCLAPHAVSVEVSVGKSIEPRVGHRSCRVHTAFADLRTTGLVRYRYDDRRPTDYITAWLQHLMLCADPPAGVALTTTGLGRDGRFRFKPCADPHGVLQGLVTLYWRGLRAPLYFFPKSAWSYIANNDSVYTAAQAWRVSKHRLHAEGADAAFRLALRGLPDPMGPGFDDFHACAHAVLDPLFACLDESPAP